MYEGLQTGAAVKSDTDWHERTLLEVELDLLREHMGELAPTSEQAGLHAWQSDDMVVFGFRDDPDGVRWLNWQGCGWLIRRLDADTNRVEIYHGGELVETHEQPSDWRLFYPWG